VRQWTGVPVRIGIAPNKTLSKIAINEIKRRNTPTSVLHLSNKNQIREALKHTPVHKVWGVGRRLNDHLNAAGINTALELADVSPQNIRKKFSIVLERTVRELRGERCLGIEDDISSKKQIVVSRSFGERVSNLETLKPIVSNFAVRAAEKLRHERQKCSQVSVFVRTSPFNKNKPQHTGMKTIEVIYSNKRYPGYSYSSKKRITTNF
jgi:DNA polymerase V